MTDFDLAETATERTAIVVYKLMLGWQPTTRDVATLCHVGDSGAWRLLSRISLTVPIYLDDDHKWRIVEGGNGHRHYVSND